MPAITTGTGALLLRGPVGFRLKPRGTSVNDSSGSDAMIRPSGADPDVVPMILVPRADIQEAKRILKSDQSSYGEMLRVISNPAAVVRARMVPGTRVLQIALNILVVLAWLTPLSALIVLTRPTTWRRALLVSRTSTTLPSRRKFRAAPNSSFRSGT